MSFDGIVTRAIVYELQNSIEGARINRIHQPGPTLLRIDVHGEKGARKVLISTGGNSPYLISAKQVPENPQTPPGFCMVLRKHLQNGRIERITQEGLDRVIHFDIQNYNELGIAARLRLTVELMGKYSNIFLCNEEGKIIEAQKRIGRDLSRVRLVYPGLMYTPIESGKTVLTDDPVLPPPPDASNPRLQKWLLQTYEGFGPLLCREIAYRAGIDSMLPVCSLTESETDRLKDALRSLYQAIRTNDFMPHHYHGEDGSSSFYAFPLRHLSEKPIAFSSMSECIEAHLSLAKEIAPTLQQESQLRTLLKQRLERTQSKLGKVQKEFEDSKDREQDLLFADLLSAHASQIPKGRTEITVVNYFDEQQTPVTIPLDPKKNPWQNAQAYYKTYTKNKNREKILREQLPQIREEIRYLQQSLHDLDRAETPAALQEIRNELRETGYLKKEPKQKKKTVSSVPLVFESSDGFTIYVGKNSRQNDELTLKTAGKEDYFFHAKDLPGSHVILRSGTREVPERTVREAAWLAAVFSSEKDADYCLVDFTKKKNVRKPKGALPGAVYYDHYETVQVNCRNPESKPIERKE